MEGVIGRIALRRAKSVLCRRRRATQVELAHERRAARRKLGSRSFGVDFGEDGGDDGRADGLADAAKQTEQREDHGYALAVARCHGGNLVADDEGAAAEGNEDLAHDDVADAVRFVLATEVDGQTSAEEGERQAEAEAFVFDAAGVAHPQTEDDAPEARADVVDLHHVACFGVVEAVHGLDELVEVLVPAVEAELDGDGNHAGSDDGALPKQLPSDEVGAGAVLLPDGEDGEKHQTDDNHGDESGATVRDTAVSLQAERQEEEHKGRHENQSADDVELVEVVGDGLSHASAARLGDKQALLLRLPFVVFEQESEGSLGIC